MKIEQISKSSYRVRKQYKGKPYTLYFDHKPTDREITLRMSDLYNESVLTGQNRASFDECMQEYIAIKNNILSPSTIKEYKRLTGVMPEWIKRINIYDITQADIQRAVNDYAINHAPKSVKNFNGFIVTVLKMYRPQFRPIVTLPKRVPKSVVLPSKEQVLEIIEYFKGSEYSIPIQLACLGMRRSEICDLKLSDLKGNQITIDSGLVTDSENNLVSKDMPKTVASVRTIYVPAKLADEIRAKGYIYKGYPNSIVRALHRAQDTLDIPRFRLHDLRHFYVSYAHSVGMVDADIMKAAGYTTDDVMKRIYRHSFDLGDAQKQVSDKLFG